MRGGLMIKRQKYLKRKFHIRDKQTYIYNQIEFTLKNGNNQR